MFKDPLLELVSNLNLTWYGFLLFYAIFSNIIDFLFLIIFNKNFGGPGRYRNYLKEKLNWLYWPLFIMGGSSAVYLITADFSNQISRNIINHGYSYQQFSFSLFNSDFTYILCVVIGLGTTIFTFIRYRKFKNLFFTKPLPFHIVRSLLFDLPLSYMVCTSILRVLDQLIVLHGFYTSGWLPITYLSADSFYGLSWAHSLLIKQIFVGILVSLVPLIMLSRKEMVEKHAKEYLAAPAIFALAITIPLAVLSKDLNSMLGNINEYFYNITITNINAFRNITSPMDTLRLIHYFQELDILSKLPRQLDLPLLLEGSLGASALFWVGYIADKVFDNFWENYPKRIKSFIKGQGKKDTPT